MDSEISVIIPVYNESSTISGCLHTLLKQSLPPKEIILIDDGSTDDTLRKIKIKQKSTKKIKILTQDHQGPAIARNLGAKQAKGKILVFVDGDMEFEPFFLENLTEPIINKKALGTWSGNEWVKNWDNIYAKCFNYNQGRSSAQMVAPASGQRKVYRAILKSEFRKVSGFDSTGYTDDWTLVEKIGQEPYITQAKFYHSHPENLLEVFHQAVWMGKRQYKLGMIGAFVAILRSNIIFSLILGIIKASYYKTPQFIMFKLVYDLGITFGAFTSLFGNKY